MMHSSFSILRNYRGSIPLIALGALAFSSIQTAQAKPESVTPIAQQQEQQRYLVQFHRDAATSQFSHSHDIKRGISLSNATINIESAGGKVVQTLPQVHAIAAYLTPKAVNKLQNDAQVIRIEKDPLRQLQAHPSKLKSDYTITTQASGEKTVIKPDGSSDRLFSIEHIRFY